jgi:hypothetical protein
VTLLDELERAAARALAGHAPPGRRGGGLRRRILEALVIGLVFQLLLWLRP